MTGLATSVPADADAPAVRIAVESPLQDDIRALIGELNVVLHELTPPEFCYNLKPEEMAQPNVTVFVARSDGRAVAIGALRRHEGGVGEVKRMYTRPEMQGRGLGVEEGAGLAFKHHARDRHGHPAQQQDRTHGEQQQPRQQWQCAAGRRPRCWRPRGQRGRCPGRR